MKSEAEINPKAIALIVLLLIGVVLYVGFSSSSGSASKTRSADCLEPKKVGPCRAAMPRWYFNKDSGKCQGFTYGGCDANKNNFATEKECVDHCKES